MKKSSNTFTLSTNIRVYYKNLRKKAIVVLETQEMSYSEFTILRMLQKEANTVSSIAQEMEVSLPYITKLTEKMGKKGLILRKKNGDDKRKVTISITAQGKKRFVLADEKINKLIEQNFKRLNSAELQVLNVLFAKLIEN